MINFGELIEDSTTPDCTTFLRIVERAWNADPPGRVRRHRRRDLLVDMAERHRAYIVGKLREGNAQLQAILDTAYYCGLLTADDQAARDRLVWRNVALVNEARAFIAHLEHEEA